MKMGLSKMSGDELVRRIFDGERDFSGIELEEGFDAEFYSGLKEYLSQNIRKDNKLILLRSGISYAKLKGLYLPYTVATGADLSHSVLSGSHLNYSNFSGAILASAGFLSCQMIGVKLYKANVTNANFEDADMSGINGIGSAIGLHTANVDGTVFKKEDAIIVAKKRRMLRR